MNHRHPILNLSKFMETTLWHFNPIQSHQANLTENHWNMSNQKYLSAWLVIEEKINQKFWSFIPLAVNKSLAMESIKKPKMSFCFDLWNIWNIINSLSLHFLSVGIPVLHQMGCIFIQSLELLSTYF